MASYLATSSVKTLIPGLLGNYPPSEQEHSERPSTQRQSSCIFQILNPDII